MRVNVDSQALRDPRFRRAAKRLQVSHHEVLARAIAVWMVCYERREATITREDIDIASELDGFTDALIASELAEQITERDIYVRGVSERIAFLDKQSTKGKKSGEVRRALSDELQKRTAVQQQFGFGSTGGLTDGSTTDRTYSPDQAPDLQDLDQQPPGRTRLPAARVLGSETSDTPTLTPKAPQNANGAASVKARPVIPDPPDEALTLAVLLLDKVIANHPGSRTAHQATKRREAMATRWAWVIEKLNRVDGQTYGAILGMINWSTAHPWWSKIILGADSVRENWDKMNGQRQRPGDKREPKKGPTQQSIEELQELERAAEEDRKMGA